MLQIIAPEFFDKLEPCLEAGDDVIIAFQYGPVKTVKIVTSLPICHSMSFGSSM